MEAKNIAMFDAITDLITSEDFKQSDKAFIEQNFHIFDVDEENKHEYKTIYDQYLEIMERLIEAKLVQEFNFTDEEVNDFYTTFQDKKAEYEARNVDTVDALYSFIEFDRFKKEMLDFKKSQTHTTGGVTEDFRKQVYDRVGADTHQAAFETFKKLQAEDTSSKPWVQKLKQTEMKEGFCMNFWQKPFEDLGCDVGKQIVLMKGIKAEQLIKAFMDPTKGVMEMVKEEKLLERTSEYNQKQYWLMAVPLMSDRDNCIHQEVEKVSDDTWFCSVKSIDHPDAPTKEGVIRLFYYARSQIRELPDDVLEYTEYQIVNMGGYMPPRLMNMLMASESSKNFKQLYKSILSQ